MLANQANSRRRTRPQHRIILRKRGYHVKRVRRFKLEGRNASLQAGAVASLQTRKLPEHEFLQLTEQAVQSIHEFDAVRQKAERLEIVGAEVIKRLDVAIASITAVLRGR